MKTIKRTIKSYVCELFVIGEGKERTLDYSPTNEEIIETIKSDRKINVVREMYKLQKERGLIKGLDYNYFSKEVTYEIEQSTFIKNAKVIDVNLNLEVEEI